MLTADSWSFVRKSSVSPRTCTETLVSSPPRATIHFARSGPTCRGEAIEKQIAVVETLVAVGKSDALTGEAPRTREAEAGAHSKGIVGGTFQCSCRAPTDRWCDLSRTSETLESTPDEMETARLILRDSISEVSVVENADGVYAFARLSSGAGYKNGAEERT